MMVGFNSSWNLCLTVVFSEFAWHLKDFRVLFVLYQFQSWSQSDTYVIYNIL